VFIIGFVLLGLGFLVLMIDKQYKIDQEDPDWRQ
jgi:hypothetical protein